MKKIIPIIILAVLPVMSFSSSANSGYPLDSIDPDISDKPSLQRGANLFMNYCYGCHSLKFQRYERVADDLGIPHDLMEQNLMFNSNKIGSLMDNPASEKDAKAWFGAAPPDLTLVSRVRGADWLYTYLRSFYIDPKRPWGVNNKVFPDVAMPHVLMDLQGGMIDTCGDKIPERDKLTGDLICGFSPDPDFKGSMDQEQFDQAVYDLVNFLVYSGEPIQLKRQQIGLYVLLFIVIFFIFAYLLKLEFWRDVKSGSWRDS